MVARIKYKLGPHNLLLAAILDFEKAYKSCSYSFNVNKSCLKRKFKHIGVKIMTSVYNSSA